MEKESTLGTMERFMTENGIKDLNMDTAFGEEFQETPISVNGDILRRKATEFTHGKTVIDMRVNGSSVLNTVKGQTSSKIRIPILESTRMVSQMVKDNTHGTMALSMLVNFLEA